MKWTRISAGLLLVALALGVGALALEFRRDLRAQHQRVQGGSRVLHTACGDIEFAESGPADAPALLLVHGSGGGFDQGLMLGQSLAPPGRAADRALALRLPAQPFSCRPVGRAPGRPPGLPARRAGPGRCRGDGRVGRCGVGAALRRAAPAAHARAAAGGACGLPARPGGADAGLGAAPAGCRPRRRPAVVAAGASGAVDRPPAGAGDAARRPMPRPRPTSSAAPTRCSRRSSR